jgi:DNA-binding GntR family transcriptional regulator
MQRDLKPGEPLPQHRLAKEMGVATGPVREAIVRLECEGLIENVAQWGARVRAWSPENLQHLYELRSAIECQTASLCCQRASDAALEDLLLQAEEVDRMRHAQPRERTKVLVAEASLHRRIAELAESPMLLEQFERVHVLELLVLIDVQIDADDSLEQQSHVELVRTIMKRDPSTAGEAVKTHIAPVLRALRDSRKSIKDC